MSTPEDRPTVGERYSVAAVSGGGGDVLLAAASKLGHPEAEKREHHALGLLLLRLHAEYDAARVDLERAGEIVNRWGARVRAADKAGDAEGAAVMRRRSVVEILTARSLILNRVQSLREAKERVGVYALVKNSRRHRPFKSDTAVWLAGRALDAWLDQTCHTCDGTGWVDGGYLRDKALQCRSCGGTGSRRNSLGKDEEQRWFGFQLVGDLQTAVDQAAGATAARLRNG